MINVLFFILTIIIVLLMISQDLIGIKKPLDRIRFDELSIETKLKSRAVALLPLFLIIFTSNNALYYFSFVFLIYLFGDFLTIKSIESALCLFLIGHILAIIFVFNFISFVTLNVSFIIPVLLFGITTSIISFYFLVKLKNPIKSAIILYSFVLGIIIGLSFVLFALGYTAFIIMFIGYILFYLSDLQLAYNKFIKPDKYAFIKNTFVYYLSLILITICFII